MTRPIDGVARGWWRSTRVGSATVVLAAAVVVLAACGSGDKVTYSSDRDPSTTTTSAPATTTTAADPPYRSTIATARAGLDPVPIFQSPNGPQQPAKVPNPNENGVPATFLVTTRESAAAPGWIEVYLPIRPNGSSGWVRTSDVQQTFTDMRVVVHLGAHTLDVESAGAVTATYPVGVGRNETPTPGGVFFIKELLKPTDPGGAYGPYAFGLSGFSNTIIHDPSLGNGVIGIHGTNEPQLVGQDVSHGCIRLRNADITALAAELPLGTPVEIDA